ncbi:MAG: YppF family protein [Bacillus sp. (in: Bacteria)]|nr:YppF family protein [Bacillus sp. (in: firmicutes)]
MLEDLIQKFIQLKKHKPNHANELLDLLKREYLQGQISITEYRETYRQLNERGAESHDKTLQNS